MTEYIRCTDCPADWVVSEEDPDSTLSDALEHARFHHTLAPTDGTPPAQMIQPGVNRCRDGVHSMPHVGCILR